MADLPIFTKIKMEELADFVTNLLTEYSEAAIIGAIIFLVFALYWRQTGRLFLIGWIVRILWLPINLLFILFWGVALIIHIIFDFIRSHKAIKFIVFVGAIWLSYEMIYLLPLSAYILYGLAFGIDTEKVYKGIFYYPKALKIPEPKLKAPKLTKTTNKETKKQTNKETAAAKPPLIAVTAPTGGSYENERGLIVQLDPHLQALINKIGDFMSERIGGGSAAEGIAGVMDDLRHTWENTVYGKEVTGDIQVQEIEPKTEEKPLSLGDFYGDPSYNEPSPEPTQGQDLGQDMDIGDDIDR